MNIQNLKADICEETKDGSKVPQIRHPSAKQISYPSWPKTL